jgi:hypothetical protein
MKLPRSPAGWPRAGSGVTTAHQRHEAGRPHISCDGSLEIVDPPLPGRQMEFDIPEPETAAAEDGADEMALF